MPCVPVGFAVSEPPVPCLRLPELGNVVPGASSAAIMALEGYVTVQVIFNR